MCSFSKIQQYNENRIVVTLMNYQFKDNMHAGQTLVTLKLKFVFANRFLKDHIYFRFKFSVLLKVRKTTDIEVVVVILERAFTGEVDF